MSDDNFVRKFEKVVKPWMIVALFLGFLVLGFCKEAEAQQGVYVEVGSGMLSGQWSGGGVIALHERCGNYSLGMGYIAEQWVTPRTEPKTYVRENLWVQGQRHVALGRFDLGIGVAYFNGTNRALGSNFTAALSLQWNVTRKWSLKFRHYSNAGSATPNMGQDMVLIGYRF